MKGPEKALIWSAAILAGVLVFTGTSLFGPAMSADSAVYLSVARNLRAGDGAVSYDGRPFVTAPPLYPLALAALPGLDRDDLLPVRLFNSVAFGLFVLLSGRFIGRSLGETGWRGFPAVGAWTIAFSRPIGGIFLFAWSETLFLPLCAGFLLAMERLSAGGNRTGTASASLLPAALFASLACLTRYTGIALVGAGAIVILVTATRRAGDPDPPGPPAPGESRRSKAPPLRPGRFLSTGPGQALLFCVFSLVPLAIWLGRNGLVAGTITGERGASAHTLMEALRSCFRTVANWIGTDGLGPAATIPGVVGVLLLAMLSLFPTSSARAPGSSGGGLSLPDRRGLAPAVFLVVYVGLLLTATVTAGFDPIDGRLLSPAFLPLLALTLGGFVRLSQYPIRRAARLAACTLAFLWLGWCGLRIADNQSDVMAQGAGGFSTRSWQTSPLVTYLRSPGTAPDDLPLMSNEPAAVYLILGRGAEPAPRRTLYNSTVVPEGEMERLERMIEGAGGVRIVWFGALDTPHVMGVGEIRERLRATPPGRGNLSTLFESVDGGVYLAFRGPAPAGLPPAVEPEPPRNQP